MTAVQQNSKLIFFPRYPVVVSLFLEDQIQAFDLAEGLGYLVLLFELYHLSLTIEFTHPLHKLHLPLLAFEEFLPWR